MSAVDRAMPQPRAAAGPDSTMGWLIAAAFFLSGTVSYGCTVCVIGFLLDPLARDMGLSTSLVSLLPSVLLLVPALLTPLTAPALQRAAPRVVMVTGALVAAVGYALASCASGLAWLVASFIVIAVGLSACGIIPSVIVVSQWMDRQRSLAVSLLFASLGVGAAIAPAPVLWLIDRFGWRGEFVATSVCFAALVIPLCLFAARRPPWALEDGEPKSSFIVLPDFSVWRESHFRRVTLLACLFGIGLMGSYVYAPLFLGSAGYGESTAAVAFSAVNLMSILGTLIIGWLADRFGPARVLVPGLLIHGLSLAAASTLHGNGFAPLAMFVVVWGLTNNVGTQLIAPLLAEGMAVERIGSAYGLSRMVTGMAEASGPMVVGISADATGSFAWSLALCGALVLASAVPAGIIMMGMARRQAR